MDIGFIIMFGFSKTTYMHVLLKILTSYNGLNKYFVVVFTFYSCISYQQLPTYDLPVVLDRTQIGSITNFELLQT